MRSVVIHLKKKPQEWHLVESLFYKVQASKQLLFLELQENNGIPRWDYLYQQVQSYIYKYRFDHWQLILLNNNEINQEYAESLTRELSFIQDKLLKPLNEKGIAPSRRIFLTLDGLKRKADYSPTIKKNYFHWQMDNFGYVKKYSEEINYGNAFLEEEILSIDEEWGDYINLKDAGTMDEPNNRFMEELNKRRSKVEKCLEKLILEKKILLDKNYLINDNQYYELHSVSILDSIYKEFCLQLKELCTPPFSYHLSHFLPSQLLKTILKENIGVFSAIGDFIVIRKTISEYSPFQKIKELIGFAFLINATVLKPEVLDRVRNGLFFEVEVVLREDDIKEMYTNYYTCLQTAKENIENRNLGQNHFMTNKYADINLLPFSTEPLEDISIESPIFQFKNRRTFLTDWNLFLENINRGLVKRESMSLEAAKEGVKVLSLTKRQTHDHFLQETMNISEYAQSMKKTKNQLQAGLEEVSPSVKQSTLKWNKSTTELRKRMEVLVKSLPTLNIIFTACLVSFLSLFVPFLSTINQPSTLISYVFTPVLLTSFIILIGFISYQSLVKPIKLLTEVTLSNKKELEDEQMLTHSKYNDYLNHIYKLFRIRNQFRNLEEKSIRQKEINVLFRWHLAEIYNHITLLTHLMDSLEISCHIYNKEKCLSLFITDFDVRRNIFHNPIYSPLECQFDKVAKGHFMEVYVENSRDEMTIWSLNPIEKIRFSQDKVYLL